MFIKRLRAENFISYKEFEMPNELHPGSNLILGLNGQGKSNFLQVQKPSKKGPYFSIEYSVEVVLDNSKQKIPVAGNEIIVKKTYNCDTDKDHYYLNGSHIQEKELFNLFESGGFSLSSQSQFQIVQQGQVEQLVLQGEEGFLKMLKQVTGTDTFDSKVEKMTTVLTECKTKKDQLGRILDSIKDRLDQLGHEIEEYKEIQKIEKEKKALECALYKNRIMLNNQEIDKLRQQRNQLMEERMQMINKREDFALQNSSQKEVIESLRSSIQLLETKIQNLNQMRNELMNSMADQEQFVSQRKDQKTLYDYFSVSYDQQMKQLSQGVQHLQKEIETLQDKCNHYDNDLSKLKQKQSEMMREKDNLLMKKEALEKFKNPQQRKKFFQDESAKIQVQLATVTKDKDDAAKNLDQNKKKVTETAQKLQVKQQEIENLKTRIKDSEKDMELARDDKKKVASQLKTFLFQQGEIELELKALKTKYNTEVDSLEKLDPSFSTLKRLRAQIQEKKIQGYRGLLLDFIEFDQRFSACIDLAAKSKLFSIIVDDLETAKEILAINNQIKGGVINIYPLSIVDQIQEKQREYPDSKEVAPLWKQIKIKEGADQKISKLIYNTFSKTVLVKNFQVAMQVAKVNNLTCITPDLQIVYAGAFITKVGQYNKSQMDRPSLYKKVAQIQRQVEVKVAEMAEIEKQREKMNEREIEALRKIQKAEVNMNSLKGAFQQLNSITYEYGQQIDHKQKIIRDQQKLIENLIQQESELQEQLKSLEKEQSQGNVQQFSDQDSNRLLFLNKTLDELKRLLAPKETERTQVANQLQQAKAMLSENYLRRQNNLEQQLLEQEIEAKILDKDVDAEGKNVSAKEIQIVEADLQRLNMELKSKNEELQKVLSQFEVAGDNEQVIQELRMKTREIEEISMKVDEVQGRNFELEASLRKIDSFDKDLYENALRDLDQQRLIQEITLKSKELDKFPRMNRHCVEWYDKYSSKHQELKHKFEDQVETEQGMLRLLQDLDQQKQQALERNFMKLNENFYEIFSRIVPNGRAEMRLIKKEQQDESQISHPSQFQEGSQVIKIGEQIYKGIKVKVSFSGQNNQLEGLGHLSGGQKAVVAASLLFALMKIDPAPFYIMDEFDNALDAEFRGALAGLIFELSKNSQFLITTFKPELIEGADKIYQVRAKNQISDIIEIDQSKAYEIINKKQKK